MMSKSSIAWNALHTTGREDLFDNIDGLAQTCGNPGALAVGLDTAVLYQSIS